MGGQLDIVRCQSCGKETYAAMVTCPHCGARLSTISAIEYEELTTELTIRVVRKAGSERGAGELTVAAFRREFEVCDVGSGVVPHSSTVLYSEGEAPLRREVVTTRESKRIAVRDPEDEELGGELDLTGADLDIEPGDPLSCLFLEYPSGSELLRVYNHRLDKEWINDRFIDGFMNLAAEFFDAYNPHVAVNRPGAVVLSLIALGAFGGIFLVDNDLVRTGLISFWVTITIISVFSLGRERVSADQWKKERLKAVRAFVDSHIRAARNGDQRSPAKETVDPATHRTIH